MEVIVITGMSGAGKSSAMRHLEDMDYFCIDNFPPRLVPGLLQSFAETEKELDSLNSDRNQKLAIGIDIRSLVRFGNINSDFLQMFPDGVDHKIIFMEASNDTLVSRYKQSRRNHPLAGTGNLIDAIQEEREKLRELRGLSDLIIDTTGMSLHDLKDFLFDLLTGNGQVELMTIFVQSFGFKYGIPLDCDLVTDVRFMPNPFYIEELRKFSGLDAPIKEYVLSFEETLEFLNLSRKFFEYSLPLYQKEGKVRLTLGVGCTGGRHRSVTISEELASILRDMDYRVFVDHRDIKRDPVGGL
ncbi:MAG TPA: RNase adapter RapZ [Clostridiaceae bacterium]|mgnify:CR=1 FL=1|nr:RNase adapter RapZ [Clostridiaceae bacterium]